MYHGISLIFIKLTKNRSLKNVCFGKMATVLAILVRGKNLTHGWNSHMLYFTDHFIKYHVRQVNQGKKQSQNLIVFFGTPCRVLLTSRWQCEQWSVLCTSTVVLKMLTTRLDSMCFAFRYVRSKHESMGSAYSPDAKGGHGGPRPPLNFQKTGNSFNFMKKMEIFRLVPPQNAEILVPLASGLYGPPG